MNHQNKVRNDVERERMGTQRGAARPQSKHNWAKMRLARCIQIQDEQYEGRRVDRMLGRKHT